MIHIVLVLAHADGFWIDFDQFGERVHEAAADGNGSAHGEIECGKFLAGDSRGRVNRGPGLAHDDNHGGCRQTKRTDEGLGLARGRAIADRDGLYLIAVHEGLDHLRRLGAVADTFFGIHHLVGEEFALGIEHSEFATGAEAGIDGENNLLTQRRGQEEFAKVFCKDTDRLLVGSLFVEKPCLSLHGKSKKALEAILGCQAHLRGRRV